VTPEDPGAEIEVRASDAEREAAIGRLRDAAGEGRLTLQELAERIEAADGARTRSDLASLVADLPAEGEPSARIGAFVPRAGHAEVPVRVERPT
jgi:Domain of unknown function (DUF1707)